MDVLERAVRFYPGVVVAVLLGLAAFTLANQYGAPVMLFALLLGMAISFLGDDKRCEPGITFCSKTVLRTGVALLGLRVSTANLLEIGWPPVLLVVAAVIFTIVLGTVLARGMRLGTEFGVLTGGAVGICGASAAMALSAVLPHREQADRQLVFAIVGVTALSTLAMIIYPPIAVYFGLDDIGAGIFIGGTVHDVAQVVGAGYTVSDRAGDLATIIKLLRVAMLVPIVFIVMFLFRKRTSGAEASARFPTFLLVFVVLAAMNSFGLIPEIVVDAGNTISRWCLVVAIAAVGIKTALQDLAEIGWPSIILIISETVFIAIFVLGGFFLVSNGEIF